MVASGVFPNATLQSLGGYKIDVFVKATDRYAERTYAVLGDEAITYGRLRDEVDRLATGLLRAGVRPGQTFAVWLTNSIEFLVCRWATY